MFLYKNTNCGLGEEFSRTKIILRMGGVHKLSWSLIKCVPCFWSSTFKIVGNAYKEYTWFTLCKNKQ